MRALSKISPDWWDYTTLDPKILKTAARLTEKDLFRLTRKGFEVVFHETIEDFYTAEALEYIEAWRQTTASRPAGICGPIGPTEQLPLVAGEDDLAGRLACPQAYEYFLGAFRQAGQVITGRQFTAQRGLVTRAAAAVFLQATEM